jgi:hypothetical protein
MSEAEARTPQTPACQAGAVGQPQPEAGGGRDAACPFSTGEGTRRARLVPGAVGQRTEPPRSVGRAGVVEERALG